MNINSLFKVGDKISINSKYAKASYVVMSYEEPELNYYGGKDIYYLQNLNLCNEPEHDPALPPAVTICLNKYINFYLLDITLEIKKDITAVTMGKYKRYYEDKSNGILSINDIPYVYDELMNFINDQPLFES